MASRLNLSGSSAVRAEVPLPQPRYDTTRLPVPPVVTTEMVNTAVESVFGGTALSEPDKNTLRKVMSLDDTTEFAQGLHVSTMQSNSVYSRLKKKKIIINYVLDHSETSDLVAYGPEFDFVFTDTESHDHAMAASMRAVDTEILMGWAPQGIPIKDVGGRPLFHIARGNVNVHCCNPVADGKDPSRITTRRMVAQRYLHSTRDEDVAQMAQGYLDDNPGYICHELSQNCHHKAVVTMSSHVYDVPIEQWPVIMGVAGASVHFGVMSFAVQALDQRSGELPVMRAKYEVDLERDTYSMGFKNSPSWWYTHKWSNFMRYAADQEIVCNGRRFSYKVVERRGDTIFFRVMRLAGSVSQDFTQHYAVPGVRMVKVDGFSYDSSTTYRMATGQKVHARPHSTLFPARLWSDMLAEAVLRFEHGDFTYDKMYNYYRTVSARHTINGVLVAGGQKVGMQQIVDLVVRSGLCAAAKVMLEQRTSRALTSSAMDERDWFASTLVSKMLRNFVAALKLSASALVYYPVVWLCDKLLSSFSSMALDQLASWEFEPDVKEYPFSTVLRVELRSAHYSWAVDSVSQDSDFSRGYIRDNMMADHERLIATHPEVARTVLETVGGRLDKQKLRAVQESASAWSDDQGRATSTLVEREVTGADEVLRKNAIQERIDEGVLERQKISGVCEKILRSCISPDGSPNADLLRKRSEEWDQPDVWFINDGIVQKSALGLTGLECRHSAVYTLTAENGSNFRVVRDESDDSEDYRVLTARYTGWALTTDRMLIFNGPEIEDTLKLALTIPHSYSVQLQQGPPGCGKTRDLLTTIQPSHVAMCPVRESAVDTRGRLVKSNPSFPDPKNRVSTIHSYLCNYKHGAKNSLQADVLQADEVYMTHSGEWYAVAALLKVKSIVAYGDVYQIPHVPRVQASKMYLRIVPTIEKVKYDIYRCPADALAAWGHIYDWKVRTHSSVRKSISVLTSAEQRSIPDGCVLMCMYQADKKELRKRYASLVKTKSLRIMTVHESEGKTFKHVWMFRFDIRVRSDAGSLYDKPAYALVAMSRHTDTFVYVRPKDLGDCLDKWIQGSQDARALMAMADVTTVGVSMRYA